MRTLAIGDIHGCNQALVQLLEILEPSPKDRIIFVGDYIDRGPESRQVVDTLLSLKEKCSPIFLRGNHEVMILNAREDPIKANSWRNCGGLEAVFSYGGDFRSDWESLIPESHWHFFANTARFFETETHIFVHACVDPELDMSEQPDWLLYWEHLDRLKAHKSGKTIICGHTPQKSGQIEDLGFGIYIDTGAATGGWLTCLDAGSGRFWQTNQQGNARQGLLQR